MEVREEEFWDGRRMGLLSKWNGVNRKRRCERCWPSKRVKEWRRAMTEPLEATG